MKSEYGKKSMMLLIVITLLSTSVFPLLSARGQSSDPPPAEGRGRGHIVKTYRETKSKKGEGRDKKEKRPEWVESALQRTLAHFKERPGTEGINDAEAELKLLGADEDDIGQTHVRLSQFHNGVPVFGGQLIAHLDERSMQDFSGRVFEEARIDTTAVLSAEQAIAAATSDLGFTGVFASKPNAKLFVLPHRVFKHEDEQGATLVYQVGLKITDEKSGPAHHQYFVDARDGSIVWSYDSMTSAYGNSLYSGSVYVNSETLPRNQFRLRDPDRGYSEVRDMNNDTTGNGFEFIDSDNTWGNGTPYNDRQTVAVDAYHGLRMAWEYFRTQHGRLGLDGYGAGVNLYVHYGVNFNNAFGSSSGLYFGDGDRLNNNPLVSLDVVGHEYTHAMIDYIIPDDSDADSDAGFIYAGESGAVEESFADIFGTEVERYFGSNFDYLIGEDFVTPFQAGGAARDMANPISLGLPDHYSIRAFQGACTPNKDTNDNCGVHTNSSIMNHVYYLLAEGGTHRLSRATIPRMGYSTTRWIFYKALTTGLTKSARFADVRRETIRVAKREFPNAPWVHQAVATAWDAVGVFEMSSAPAAISRGSNTLDVFTRGSDGACWHRAWNGSAWTVWESLGGYIIGAPAVASWGPNRMDVFVRGGDNQLYQNTWNGFNWSGWTPLGGVLTSSPTAVSWGSNRMDVFVTGTDYAVHTLVWDGSRWLGWFYHGGYTFDAPAVSSRGFNRLDLFGRGTDNRLYQKIWNGSYWTDWMLVPDGVLASAPTAVSWDAYEIDVFVRGTDNACYGRSFREYGWTGWYSLGGGTYDAPAVASRSYAGLDVFVRGTDNQLYQRNFDAFGSGWTGWMRVP
jgi:thermolysin